MSLMHLPLEETWGRGRTLAKFVNSSLSLRDQRKEVGVSVDRSA